MVTDYFPLEYFPGDYFPTDYFPETYIVVGAEGWWEVQPAEFAGSGTAGRFVVTASFLNPPVQVVGTGVAGRSVVTAAWTNAAVVFSASGTANYVPFHETVVATFYITLEVETAFQMTTEINNTFYL